MNGRPQIPLPLETGKEIIIPDPKVLPGETDINIDDLLDEDYSDSENHQPQEPSRIDEFALLFNFKNAVKETIQDKEQTDRDKIIQIHGLILRLENDLEKLKEPPQNH